MVIVLRLFKAPIKHELWSFKRGEKCMFISQINKGRGNKLTIKLLKHVNIVVKMFAIHVLVSRRCKLQFSMIV